MPLELSEEELKWAIKASYKIICVQSLNRAINRNNKTEYVPSQLLCIKFAGQQLPEWVTLFYDGHPVSPYVPKVRICYSCYRVGHTQRICNSNPRCMTSVTLRMMEKIRVLLKIIHCAALTAQAITIPRINPARRSLSKKRFLTQRWSRIFRLSKLARKCYLTALFLADFPSILE